MITYHAEGRLVPGSPFLDYQYTLQNHLGNSRISFTDDNSDGVPEVIQENHYYPFGMNMEGSWAPQVGPTNRYQYNGKELNGDFGLDWNDYGARWYDASIARWYVVDPLAEPQVSFSSYSYTFNNPIKYIDPTGMMGTAAPLPDAAQHQKNLSQGEIEENRKKASTNRAAGSISLTGTSTTI